MKRLISLLLALLLLVSAVPAGAAADGEVRVKGVTARPGAVAAVPITLNDDQGLVSMLLTVDYDSRLALEGVEDTGLLPGANHKPELSNPYTLSWENDTSTQNYRIHGTIATLYFRIPEDAEPGTHYSVSVSYDYDNYDIFDTDQNLVRLTCVDGGITVEEPAALTIENAPEYLTGGKSVTLQAALDGVTANVTWSVRSGDSAYASINTKGKLTTKAVPSAHTVRVKAVSANGAEAVADITLRPVAVYASISPKAGQDGVIPVDLRNGSSIRLTAKTLPAAASDDGTWKTSSSSIATVKDGLVEFKKAGLVTVTFTAGDGSKKTASVKLRAGIPMEDLTLTGADTLVSGAKTTLKAEFNSLASYKTLTWSVSDSTLASVTAKGVVTAKTVYEPTAVTVTVRASDGSGAAAQKTITLTPKANVLAVKQDGRVVNGTTRFVDLRSAFLTLTAPEGCTWSSSSKAVAEVADGVVTFKKAGTVTITAKLGTASGKVTVKAARLVDGLNIEIKSGNPTLTSGKGKLTLKALPVNTDATTKTVTWSSSDPKVASVSSSGVVTAKAGVYETTPVVITAKAKDGSGREASFDVTVIPAATGVSVLSGSALTTVDGIQVEAGEVLSGRTLTLYVGDTVTFGSKVYPQEANSNVTWKLSSTKLVQQNPDGSFTALKKGTVTITVTAADGSAKKTTVKLKIL